MGTPNGLREPVWWGLRGCGGGEEGLLCVRGVEAGRAGTNTEAFPLRVDVCIVGWGRFVEAGWLKEAKEKGCETGCD